jgi:small conductance mechanosensitive channel
MHGENIMESLLNSETDYLNLYIIPWGVNLVMALVIFIVGRWIAKFIRNIVKRLMDKAEMDEILTNFVGNMLYFALLIVVVIAALDQLGINTTSVMAIFAAAGLAVGLALKDSLSNFSAGVMLVHAVTLRPVVRLSRRHRAVVGVAAVSPERK